MNLVSFQSFDRTALWYYLCDCIEEALAYLFRWGLLGLSEIIMRKCFITVVC